MLHSIYIIRNKYIHIYILSIYIDITEKKCNTKKSKKNRVRSLDYQRCYNVTKKYNIITFSDCNPLYLCVIYTNEINFIVYFQQSYENIKKV